MTEKFNVHYSEMVAGNSASDSGPTRTQSLVNMKCPFGNESLLSRWYGIKIARTKDSVDQGCLVFPARKVNDSSLIPMVPTAQRLVTTESSWLLGATVPASESARG